MKITDFEDLSVPLVCFVAVSLYCVLWFVIGVPIAGTWIDENPAITIPIAFLLWETCNFLWIGGFMAIIAWIVQIRLDMEEAVTTRSLRWAVAGYAFYRLIDLPEAPFVVGPTGEITQTFLWKASSDTFFTWIVHSLYPSLQGLPLYQFQMCLAVGVLLGIVLLAIGPDLRRFIKDELKQG